MSFPSNNVIRRTTPSTATTRSAVLCFSSPYHHNIQKRVLCFTRHVMFRERGDNDSVTLWPGLGLVRGPQKKYHRHRLFNHHPHTKKTTLPVFFLHRPTDETSVKVLLCCVSQEV